VLRVPVPPEKTDPVLAFGCWWQSLLSRQHAGACSLEFTVLAGG